MLIDNVHDSYSFRENVSNMCVYMCVFVGCMTFIIKLGMFMQIYIFTKIIKENLEKNILLLSALISLFCIFLHIVYIL